MPRQELLYAHEEAVGSQYLPQLESIADIYLAGTELTAKLYKRPSRKNMFSDRYGDVTVMRIAVADFDTHRIALVIGQSILHHWLEAQGGALARPASALLDESTRSFWTAAASHLTRGVRGVAVGPKLAELELGEVIKKEVDHQVSMLRERYSRSYVAPTYEQFGFWTESL